MTKKQKAQQVADILTGKVYLCKGCGEYHVKDHTLYVNGVELAPFCSKTFTYSIDYGWNTKISHET